MPDTAQSADPTSVYGPFVGFMSAVDRDVIPPDRISGNSSNLIPDPLNGTLYTRYGTVTVNDSAAAPTGLGESKFSSRTRHIFEFKSTSQSDGYPTYGVVNTNETTNEGFLAWWDTNVSGTRVLGQDCTDNVHYPRSTTPSVDYICLPLKSRHSPTTGTQRRDYTRGNAASSGDTGFGRKTMLAGTRKAVQMNDEIFFPNYSGTPMRWNKVWNPTGSGTNVNRIRPWGAYPPVGELKLTATAGAGKNWTNGYQFYYSVIYEFMDGSFSMPMIPRAVNANMAAGFGSITLGASSDYITVSQIPVGPYGTRRVWIARSPQAGSAGVKGDPNDLRLTGYVPNGTTSYTDTFGDVSEAPTTSAGLVADSTRVRFDHVWPWRARFGFNFDERVCLGYLRPNPSALMIVPHLGPGPGVWLGGNTDDSVSTVTATRYTVSIRDDKVGAKSYLVHNDGGTTTTNEQKYDLSTYTVLQDLVDAINAYAGAAAVAAFRAQLIPGADGGTPTSKLDYTQVKTTCAAVGGSGTVTSAAMFANVKVGMVVYDATTPGNIPTGSRVTAVGSTSSLTISNNASAFAADTIYFGWDVGDTARGDFATSGSCLPGDFRTYAAAYPVVLYLNETYMDTLDNERWKRTLMFTSGEPGSARQCPNFFVNSLKMSMPAAGGILQGGAPLHTQTQILGVVLGSKQCYAIVNPRGGNTALDADIRLRAISGIKGCIAPDSITYGDGWVGFLSEDGFIVTDGANFECISRDVWNVGSATAGVGEWGYEIQQCRNASAADTGEPGSGLATAQFHALAYQGTIYCNYRSSNSYDYPDSQICYDYSPGLAASGLQEVTRGPSEAYGWSAPLSNHAKSGKALYFGTMGIFSNSAGVYYLMADDSNPGSAGDGMLRQFNYASAYADDTSGYPSLAYLKTDRCGSLLRKRCGGFRALLKKGSGGSIVFTLYRDRARSSGVTILTTETGAVTSPPKRYRRWPKVQSMSAADVYEVLVTSPSGVSMVLFQTELDFSILDSSF